MANRERFHFPPPNTPEEEPSSATPESAPNEKEAQAKRLLDEIDQLVGPAATPGDYQAIGNKLSAIERLYAPETKLEKELQLQEQYESQKQILKTTGILETLANGQEGIIGIDGREYPYPAYDEVKERVAAKEDILEQKAEQGFTKLLVVPVGMSLDDLLDKYKAVILKHHQAGKLLATKENPQDPDKPLELDENQPLWVWDGYQGADREGRLVYYPKAFDKDNHQGQTKRQIIEEQGIWNVLLIEDLPNIPRATQDPEEIRKRTQSGRRQLEANQTPTEYLTTLTNANNDPQLAAYRHEQGLTPEDHIIYAITHLEETNQVIDDYRGHGSINYNLGGYFPAEEPAGRVARAYWRRAGRRALLGGGAPGDRREGIGARAAVGVKRP